MASDSPARSLDEIDLSALRIPSPVRYPPGQVGRRQPFSLTRRWGLFPRDAAARRSARALTSRPPRPRPPIPPVERVRRPSLPLTRRTGCAPDASALTDGRSALRSRGRARSGRPKDAPLASAAAVYPRPPLVRSPRSGGASPPAVPFARIRACLTLK
ncbi:hypothetical protein SKAU_G00198830 [Synaphobranchus kaupii]|uniref:Uncharacterized protein n=1 Tax=Synaphobranchus kaupii TaxID=118154 RepID=A0A9Q1FF57_SYNKA|nr:hypothetical protein SKAU_G00198830 [Synaphobranchus kaupii]